MKFSSCNAINDPQIRPGVLPEGRSGGSRGCPPSCSPRSSRGDRPEVPQANQVVGGYREGEHPADPVAAPKARLATQPDRLQPAEHLLDALAEALAPPV